MELPSRADDAPVIDPDAADLLAYAAGDAVAFDALYARHKGAVYRYLLRHCGHPGTAEELFQEVWMRVIRSRREYAPNAPFATWLYTIARNRIVDHWRASARASGMLGSADADDVLESLAADESVEPPALLVTAEVRKRLHAALAALPFAQRDAFLLHHEAGLALADVAALTGANPETVKSRLRYAIARLRQSLGDLR